MGMGLLVTVIGVIVAGLAGILGVWMERDPGGTKGFAAVFSFLILGATAVEMSHAVAAEQEASQADAKMAFLLEQLSALAASGDNPALSAFVGTELAIAARANPAVVKKMEDSISEKGGDPSTVMQTAKAGRRQAAGLSAEPPKAGEKPQLSPAFAGQQATTLSGATSGLVGDDLTDQLPVEVPVSVDDAKEQATQAATKAVDDAKEQATEAVDDAKEQATEAVDDAKEEAEAKAREAEQKAKEEADAKKKEAEEKAKKEAAKKKKAAEKKKKEAEEKAKNAGKAGDLLNK